MDEQNQNADAGLGDSQQVDTQTVDTNAQDTGLGDNQQQQTGDEFSGFENALTEYDKANPNDPQNQQQGDQQQQGALPEVVQQAMQGSEYFKQPEHLQTAVLAATELFDVENGKRPAYQMLEGFRARNPEGFSRMMQGDSIPYIEKLTGKKLGGEAIDESTPEGKVAKLERQMAEDRQNRETSQQQSQQNARIEQANIKGSQHLDEVLKGTPVEGMGERVFSQLGSAIQNLGMDPNKVMLETLGGNWANFDRAVKQVQRQEFENARKVMSNFMTQQRNLKKSLPVNKSGSTAAAGSDPNNMQGWSRQQQAEYLETGAVPA